MPSQDAGEEDCRGHRAPALQLLCPRQDTGPQAPGRQARRPLDQVGKRGGKQERTRQSDLLFPKKGTRMKGPHQDVSLKTGGLILRETDNGKEETEKEK